jgi:hypothetical protein
MRNLVGVLSISGLIALGTGATSAAPGNIGAAAPGAQTSAAGHEHVVQVRHGHRHWRGHRWHRWRGWHGGHRWHRRYYGYRPYYYHPRRYYYRNYYYPSYYYPPAYYYSRPSFGIHIGF